MYWPMMLIWPVAAFVCTVALNVVDQMAGWLQFSTIGLVARVHV